MRAEVAESTGSSATVGNRVGGRAQVEVLAPRFVVVGDERRDERRFLARQHAERVERYGFHHGIARTGVVHRDTRSPSESRMRRKPLRMRVFTVPSGVSVRRASS